MTWKQPKIILLLNLSNFPSKPVPGMYSSSITQVMTRTLKDENGNPMFYLVSSNVGALDQDKMVKKDGLSGFDLINYSKKIRAGKQMFLFDACESEVWLKPLREFKRILEVTSSMLLLQTSLLRNLIASVTVFLPILC